MNVMVYDGDCGFCRKWARRWRRITGRAVAYAPYQRAADWFPHVPRRAFERAVQLVEDDGRISSGAQAVFRALAISGRAGWPLRLYHRSRVLARASERMYALVAAHRRAADRLDRWAVGLTRALAGKSPPGPHRGPGQRATRGRA